MSVRRLGTTDLDWMVGLLAERRRSLSAFAPVLWRPAPDAERRHREFLGHLLRDGGAAGYRTDDAFMLAQPGQAGWVIDDLAVGEGRWHADGAEIWDALRPEISGTLRWVCPGPEPEGAQFASQHGFELVESWWHRDIDTSVPADLHAHLDVAAAATTLVEAPPVYSPGGPVLFVTEVGHPAQALAGAATEAARVGAVVVVVAQPASDQGLAAHLSSEGFSRHCDFLEGDV